MSQFYFIINRVNNDQHKYYCKEHYFNKDQSEQFVH